MIERGQVVASASKHSNPPETRPTGAGGLVGGRRYGRPPMGMSLLGEEVFGIGGALLARLRPMGKR
jgi:hypothetical protein